MTHKTASGASKESQTVRTPLARSCSPFRYPGGKGFLTSFLAEQIEARFGASKPQYLEPYCGGAGAAVNLLLSDRVEALHLNDADHRVYSAWRAMLTETERFIDRINRVQLNIASWNKSLALVYDAPTSRYSFDVGFSTFFINRTSRSGVIRGAGPIGGYAQDGTWKIDARFNKATLRARVRALAKRRKEIKLSCEDGLVFCKSVCSKSTNDRLFFFIDPPYVHAGGRLYYDGMNCAKHSELADWLKSDGPEHWVVTYDNHQDVRLNFAGVPKATLDVRYSLGKRRVEKELMFVSRN